MLAMKEQQVYLILRNKLLYITYYPLSITRILLIQYTCQAHD